MSEPTFLDVVERCNAMPARFHVQPGAPTNGTTEAVSFAALNEPSAMRRALDDFAGPRGITDHQVAASLFQQGIALRVIAVSLAGALLDGLLLRPTPEQLHVAANGPSFLVGIDHPEIVPFDRDDLDAALGDWHAHWTAGLFEGLNDAVRSVQRVGRRLLRANVASAVTSNLVFLDWWQPGAGFDRRAEAVLRSGLPNVGVMSTMASFEPIEFEGRVGLASGRNSCCLQLQAPAGHACPTCPLITAEERAAAHRLHLGHLAAFQRTARSLVAGEEGP